MYKVMKDCWDLNPKKRPTFKHVRNQINQFMNAPRWDTPNETPSPAFQELFFFERENFLNTERETPRTLSKRTSNAKNELAKELTSCQGVLNPRIFFFSLCWTLLLVAFCWNWSRIPSPYKWPYPEVFLSKRVYFMPRTFEAQKFLFKSCWTHPFVMISFFFQAGSPCCLVLRCNRKTGYLLPFKLLPSTVHFHASLPCNSLFNQANEILQLDKLSALLKTMR